MDGKTSFISSVTLTFQRGSLLNVLVEQPQVLLQLFLVGVANGVSRHQVSVGGMQLNVHFSHVGATV